MILLVMMIIAVRPFLLVLKFLFLATSLIEFTTFWIIMMISFAIWMMVKVVLMMLLLVIGLRIIEISVISLLMVSMMMMMMIVSEMIFIRLFKCSRLFPRLIILKWWWRLLWISIISEILTLIDWIVMLIFLLIRGLIVLA